VPAWFGVARAGHPDAALAAPARPEQAVDASEFPFAAQPAQKSKLSQWQRDEADQVAIQSGTEHGVTLGTPIGLRVQNKDQRPHDYSETDLYPRPSHADWSYLLKYGIKASSGGGRASARETIGGPSDVHLLVKADAFVLGRVAAGAIAEKYLFEAHKTEIVAFVSSVGAVEIPRRPKRPSDATQSDEEEEELFSPEYLHLLDTVTRDQVDQTHTRCPDLEVAKRMEAVSCLPTCPLKC
jgi:chorismate synthase